MDLLLLPLPYRNAALVVLGVWAWYLNLRGLEGANIDVASMLKIQSGKLSRRVLRTALALTAVLTCSIGLFWIQIKSWTGKGHELPTSASALDVLPFLTLILIVVLLLFPGRSPGHHRFWVVFSRIALGRIDVPTRLGDILLADGLISYARVLGDVGVVFCELKGGQTLLGLPDRTCGSLTFIPFLTVIPSLIRLRQCFIELKLTGNKTHLYNFIKYGTSLPAAAFAVLHRAGWNCFGLWILAQMINSGYSLFWDITKDWGLSLNLPDGRLRKDADLHFNKALYQMAIVVDVMLRFAFLLKLSSTYSYLTEVEGGMFVFTFLELFRRWIWVFFRVENEWANQPQEIRLKSLPVTEQN